MPDDQQQNNAVPEPAVPVPESVATPAEDIAAKLAACEAKRDEYLAGWQRERADFQNYKKDEFKRLAESREAITAAIIEDMLPALDSFDIAIDFARAQRVGRILSEAEQQPNQNANEQFVKSLVHGFEQVRLQLLDILKRMGVEAVKVEEGKMMFDPVLHEAVEEAESDKPEGMVLEELQKGYTLNGKTLRPARVRVSKGQVTRNGQ